MIPKAELHVHLEGTAPPDLIRRLAERNGMRCPAGCSRRPTASPNGLPRLPEDLRPGGERDPHRRRLPRHHLRVPGRLRRGRARSTSSSPPRPTTPRSSASATRSTSTASLAGSTTPARDFGIEGRILISCVRNFGVEPALRGGTPRRRATAPLRGRLLDGRRRGELPGAATTPSAFEIAAGAGLGCTVHAGEWAGAESVRAALGLPVTRIAHGVRAIEDPALVEELAERGIVLECCPTSNVVLGVYPSYEEHPLPRLREAGVRVTLGLRRPALLRRLDRRRVRRSAASASASATRTCARSRGPPSRPHSARKRSKSA